MELVGITISENQALAYHPFIPQGFSRTEGDFFIPSVLTEKNLAVNYKNHRRVFLCTNQIILGKVLL